jgi:hypothetical protein
MITKQHLYGQHIDFYLIFWMEVRNCFYSLSILLQVIPLVSRYAYPKWSLPICYRITVVLAPNQTTACEFTEQYCKAYPVIALLSSSDQQKWHGLIWLVIFKGRLTTKIIYHFSENHFIWHRYSRFFTGVYIAEEVVNSWPCIRNILLCS